MRCVIFGHSHIDALVHASRLPNSIVNTQKYVEFRFIRMPILSPAAIPLDDGRWILNHTVMEEVEKNGGFDDRDSIYVSIMGGNEYNTVGLLEHVQKFDVSDSNRSDSTVITSGMMCRFLELYTKYRTEFLPHMLSRTRGPFMVLETPPPIESEQHIVDHLDPGHGLTREEIKIAPASLRMKLWLIVRDLIRENCAKLGIEYIPTPEAGLDNDFLAPAYWSHDATHGNIAFGELWLRHLHELILSGRIPKARNQAITLHPYVHVPDFQKWSKAVTQKAARDVDPVVAPKFTISTTDKVATAGSCFAQHMARRLASQGLCYFVAEQAHPMIPPKLAEKWNYGVYSCRFGNVYTAKQLRQLFDRVYGRFAPLTDFWRKGEAYIDPFRPAVQPGGFVSLEELHRDREQHLAAVRRMFEQMNVFVFTLGLTEYWADAADGAAFPVCPGVAGGEFDPQRHVFVNQRVSEVVEDMTAFISNLREVNPSIRVMLTVSPVPLAATADNRHVIVSTTYSKSVLRVAVDELQRVFPDIAYFPSYEIITGSFNRGSYYSPDLREVLEVGVDHVMHLFFKHYAPDAPGVPAPTAVDDGLNFTERAQALVQAICEEKLLDLQD